MVCIFIFHCVTVQPENTANTEAQTANPFLYNTFNLPNNANISRCYLEVGN